MKKIITTLLVAALCSGTSLCKADNVNVAVNGENISIGLDNEEAYVAFQMDVTLPEGMTASQMLCTERLVQGDDVTIEGEKVSTDFRIVCNMIEENVLRVVTYNMGNNRIEGNDGGILDIAFSYVPVGTSTIGLSNIRFVKASDLSEVILENTEVTYTKEDMEDKIVDILPAEQHKKGLSFNLQGIRVNGTPRGVVIKDGKKVLY